MPLDANVHPDAPSVSHHHHNNNNNNNNNNNSDCPASDNSKGSVRPTYPPALALWNFSSQWFLIPQGTGIIAVILHQLDYQFNGLEILSEIVWVYAIVLLATCLFLYLLRLWMYPRRVIRVLRADIGEMACLASIPISLTPLIQMITLTLVRDWGSGWGMVAYVLWWVDTAMSVLAVLFIPYVFMKLQSPGTHAVSPVVQLPLIAALTSAAGGGTICYYGGFNEQLQIPVIIVSYLEVGLGLSMAISLDDVYMARLFDRSFPDALHVFQNMILCGPYGQGSFALQILGQVVQGGTFAAYNRGTLLTGEAAPVVGFASQFGGLLAWGYGTFWWCFSITGVLHTLIEQPGGIKATRFTLTVWSLVFPWGVYTNGAMQLGKIMDSTAFKAWSTALALMLVIIWLTCQFFTVKNLVTGHILGLEHGWRTRRYRESSNNNV